MTRPGPGSADSPWWRTPEGVGLLARVSRGVEAPGRLRLLAALVAREQSVASLTRLVGRSMPRVSKQLAVLRAQGLVERRVQGPQRFYQLAPHDPAAQAVRALLTELARGGGTPDHG